MTAPRITAKLLGEYVRERKAFIIPSVASPVGASCYGEIRVKEGKPTVYAAFSYGPHFPMAVYVSGEGWYVNGDKATPSTSKQMRAVLPYLDKYVTMTCAQLKAKLESLAE